MVDLEKPFKFIDSRGKYAGIWDWCVAVYNRLILKSPVWLPGKHRRCKVRLAGMPIPFVARLGTTDFYVLEEIFLKKEYEPALDHAGDDVRLIMDLGSNVGYSLRYWQQYYPKARMIAIEPDLGNVSVCRQNVELAGFPHQVQLLQTCVGGWERKANLNRSTGAWAYSIVPHQPNPNYDVEVTTIPAILASLGGVSRIDLLKCDIEGTESELFRNCAAWIWRVRALVVELHPPYTINHLWADLEMAGIHFDKITRTKSDLNPVLFMSAPRASRTLD